MTRLLFLLLSLSTLSLAKLEVGRGPNSLAREAELELTVDQEGSQGEVRYEDDIYVARAAPR